MSNINAPIPTDLRKRHLRISLLLLSGLLFLRLPFLTTAGLLFSNDYLLRAVAFLIFIVCTYLLTAILIWWEREQLKEFWIDLASAITFLCQMYCFPIGIGLFLAMLKKRAKFPPVLNGVWRWLLVGAILALVCNIFTSSTGLEPSDSRSGEPATFMFLIPAILIQMTNAAVFEEPLFRGFLWGYLRRWRWPNILIWLFQAGLFTLGHAYYLKDEAFFPWLVRMMLPSLILGLIAWRAQSIFASMVTHGVFNASGDMLLHTRSLSEAINVSWIAVIILTGVLVEVLMVDWMRQRQANHFIL